MQASFYLALVAGILRITTAHMILQQPVPWGIETIDNSPLDNAFPGNYPCKQRTGVYAMPSTGFNHFAVGSNQTISFKGSATHGGGSCQLSVTTDLHPTSTSTFKVIYSIIGGCPLDPFDFTVPAGLPNGQYTLAWTWYNKIGNRELYMNCAPIEVSGGTDNLDAFNALPNMYTINLPNTGCESEDSKDLVFPHPGKYVTTVANTALATAGPSDRGQCAKQTAIGAGNGKVMLPAGVLAAAPATTKAASAYSTVAVSAAPTTLMTSYVAASSSGKPSSAGQSPTAYSLPSVYPPPSSAVASSVVASSVAPTSTVATSAAYSSIAAAPSMGSSLPAVPAISAPYPTMVASSPAATPSSGSGSNPLSGSGTAGYSGATGGTSKCSSEGTLMCSADGSQFGLCNHGGVVWQAVAAGTKCVGGEIV